LGVSKKVAKIVVIVIGLFLVGLIYLQYQQIVTINSDKLQQVFQDTVTTLANATTQIHAFNSGIATISGIGRTWMRRYEFAPDRNMPKHIPD
jgi:uncharacterized membrane protein (Fun14 family)